MNKIMLFISCIIGTMLEWYDFAVFGLLAPVLAKIFFPFTSHINALLISFLIFATGFAMRPIGGIFFGHIGDKYGRKKAIVPAVMLMTIATVCIGLLPEKANYFTVAALVFCRLAQGFAVSGEYSGVLTLISEQTTPRKSFFYQGFVEIGVMMGFLLGSLVAKFALSHTFNFIASWRIPFLVSFILCFFGLYLRLQINETKPDHRITQKNKIPIKILFSKKYFKTVIFGILYIMGGTVEFYFISIYLPSYFHYIFKTKDYLNIPLIFSIIHIIFIPIFSYITIYINILYLIIFYLTLYIILPLLLIIIFISHKPLSIYSIIIALCVAHSLGKLLCNSLIVVLFPIKIRYTASAFISNISVCLFGGTTPFICWLIIKITGWHAAPAIYASFTALISLVAVICYKSKILAVINIDEDKTQELNINKNVILGE